MSLLIFCFVVLIVVALVIWAIQLLPLPSPINPLLQVLIVLAALLVIVQRAGML